jgi:2,4-dienoyl-CoA reductase-like NADH-dependent reductase (Old Yellow Enzyme family)
MIFEPFTLKNVTLKNRILRSSIGGRTSYYDGTVNSAWKNFEKRFAENDVAGIISATITVDDRRWSPLEYPKISNDKFIKPLREGIQAVQKFDCKYIIQIGDAGYQTQTSLFSQEADAKSASKGFDLLFGYRNHSIEMSVEEIEQTIHNFALSARRVRETGCDGLEITASKGYIIHQFLNPVSNRRTDKYGGSVEKRFRFLQEIVEAVRQTVGSDFLFGIRLSAVDYNYLPVNLRLPVLFPIQHYLMGNGLEETIFYAKELEKLGVDYLHISAGFGFINPKENPGDFPIDELRMFVNSNRHLSLKSNIRAILLNAIPKPILSLILGRGWKFVPGVNAEHARKFKEAVNIPIIANGGFQQQDLIEATLREQKCDLVSMARPLLANPDLLKVFKEEKNEPEKPCTFCNRCTVRTVNFPLGCYEPLRFSSQDEMEAEILRWSATLDS